MTTFRIVANTEEQQPSDHRPFHRLRSLQQSVDIPKGVVRVTGEYMIQGNAFFPCGSGLWRMRGQDLPPTPEGGVMVVARTGEGLTIFRR